MKLIILVVSILFTSAISATTVKFDFVQNSIFGYSCEISNIELLNATDDLTFEHGEHKVRKEISKTDADVKMIYFTKSTVNYLPNKLFSYFTNVETLDLMSVQMTKWVRTYIKGAKNLKKIWLGNNEITELGDNSFMAAIGLENLVLYNNKLTTISDKAFNGLLQIKSIELQNNLLTTLSGNVFSPLKKLKELNLSENLIAKIDENVFYQNLKLEFLNLASNHLVDLPMKSFMNLANLTILYLNNNHIEELSSEMFSGCSSLMELRMDDNKLKMMPNGIFKNNKKFKLLNIMNNQIESFDASILPTGMEMLHLDETVTTQHVPEKLQVFRAEIPEDTTNKYTEEMNTVDK